MIVLVTGAGGFVAGALAEGFTRRGHRVLAADLSFDASARRRLTGAERLDGDLGGTLAALARGGRRVDAVIHGATLTASPEASGLSLAEHLARNMDPLLAALTAAERLRARRFVFLSSGAVFAPEERRILDEGATPDARGPYSAAKRAGEILTACLSAGRLEAVSVRLGNLYGPEERPRPTRPRVSLAARMLHDARTTGRIAVATPDALRDWTCLPDLIEPFEQLLSAALPAPVLHLCAPLVATDRELAEQVAATVPGTTVAVAPEPDRAATRPPLASRHALRSAPWTSLADGLALLAAERRAA